MCRSRASPRRNCRNLILRCQVYNSCRSNFLITTILIPWTARMSSALACATRFRPSATASSTSCSTGISRLTGGSTPAAIRTISTNRSSPQQTFSDLYSDLAFKPRSWIILDSKMREDVQNGDLNFAFYQLTFAPDNRWSWGAGYWYQRAGFDGFDASADYITSVFYYRFDDNWGYRMEDDYNAAAGRLQPPDACNSSFTRFTGTCGAGPPRSFSG